MCGIAGIFHADPKRPVDPETLIAMAAIQHHRGPDGFGYHVMEGCGVGFSHARLAIIDLGESGRQPLVDANSMLAMNGELYDFQRIRADLTARGHRFTTKSDSEIVPHLYQRLGFMNMLPHLRGEFAFSLYDAARDELFLVRDRFGIKPLYWSEHNGTLVFGSEIKVLFAHPNTPRAFSSTGLYHQLMQTKVPGTTPFDGVHQVKPGHWLKITRRNGCLEVTGGSYWDMEFPQLGDRDPQVSEEKVVDAVREKLLEAVQLRLVADVPVGCYLSGGIDSCSILGLASAVRQGPVKAFTIGFDNAEYDESHIAREMAESVGAEQDILSVNGNDLYHHFVETHWHTERTIYNTLGVAKFLMSRHVKNSGYKVVVTGEGSDELFAGYPSFRQDLFSHGLDHLPEAERTLLSKQLGENNKLFKGAMLAETAVQDPFLQNLCGFTPSCLQPWLATAPYVPGLLSSNLAEQLKDYQPGQAIAAALNPEMIKNRHPLDIAQYVWIKTMLEGQILTWGGDRVDMANSMEARPPFLDHHLAELACTIPPELRIKNGREKHVLREAMKGVLPEVLYNREKFAFMAPPAHTDPHKMKMMLGLASDYLSHDALSNAGLLNVQGVQALLTRFQDPSTPAHEQVQLDAVINHLLGVQILHRHMVASDLPAKARQSAKKHDWAPTK